MAPGGTIAEVDFTQDENHLDYDQQVRCLSYLIKRLDEFVDIPKGLEVKVAPVQYLGGPYPAIYYYPASDAQMDKTEIPHPFLLQDKIDTFIQDVGIKRLLELSDSETLTWHDVLSSNGKS